MGKGSREVRALKDERLRLAQPGMGFPQQPVEQFLGEVEQSFWPAEIVVDVETVGSSVVSIDAEMAHQVAASVNERIGGGRCAQQLLQQRERTSTRLNSSH